jgi:hypothetical protein
MEWAGSLAGARDSPDNTPTCLLLCMVSSVRVCCIGAGEDHAGQEDTPEVAPAGGECVWIQHGQLEAPPHCRVVRTVWNDSK